MTLSIRPSGATVSLVALTSNSLVDWWRRPRSCCAAGQHRRRRASSIAAVTHAGLMRIIAPRRPEISVSTLPSRKEHASGSGCARRHRTGSRRRRATTAPSPEASMIRAARITPTSGVGGHQQTTVVTVLDQNIDYLGGTGCAPRPRSAARRRIRATSAGRVLR